MHVTLGWFEKKKNHNWWSFANNKQMIIKMLGMGFRLAIHGSLLENNINDTNGL